MFHNEDDIGVPVTSKNDPRMTRSGQILRKYKLDELPQLINVLKGDMSLVGPRPEVPLYTSLYTKDEASILSIRPGITDYSSIEFVQLGDVLGPDDNASLFEDQIKKVLDRKIELRMKYLKEMSFLVDIKIIFKTFVKLIRSF